MSKRRLPHQRGTFDRPNFIVWGDRSGVIGWRDGHNGRGWQRRAIR